MNKSNFKMIKNLENDALFRIFNRIDVVIDNSFI